MRCYGEGQKTQGCVNEGNLSSLHRSVIPTFLLSLSYASFTPSPPCKGVVLRNPHFTPPHCRASIAGGVLFCHIITPTAWLLTPYLNHDYFPFVLISLLGLTQVWRVWRM